MTVELPTVTAAEAYSAPARLPSASEILSFGRLAWVRARLEGLSGVSCETHDAHVECYELSAARSLVEELFATAEVLGLIGRRRGYPETGIVLPVNGSECFLVPMRAGRREKASREDMFLLWPMVRGCPSTCQNLPRHGIYGIAPEDDVTTIDPIEFELRWALQVVDGMPAEQARATATQLLS